MEQSTASDSDSWDRNDGCLSVWKVADDAQVGWLRFTSAFFRFSYTMETFLEELIISGMVGRCSLEGLGGTARSIEGGVLGSVHY